MWTGALASVTLSAIRMAEGGWQKSEMLRWDRHPASDIRHP